MSKKKHKPSPSPSTDSTSKAASASSAASSGVTSSKADRDASTLSLAVGWTLITFFLAFGLVLESFHLIKLPAYLDVRLRRELWTLAHAHGTLLGAINVLFGLSAVRCLPYAATRTTAARLLIAGALLVPLGFLGGGIANAEGDPSPAILLVPTGALLALLGVGILARGAWKQRS